MLSCTVWHLMQIPPTKKPSQHLELPPAQREEPNLDLFGHAPAGTKTPNERLCDDFQGRLVPRYNFRGPLPARTRSCTPRGPGSVPPRPKMLLTYPPSGRRCAGVPSPAINHFATAGYRPDVYPKLSVI